MTTIEWTYYVDGEDGEEELVVDLPAKWEICRVCDGEGKHSLAIGAITQEDRDRDWSNDEWDDYLAGVYDSQCLECKGTGKVLEVDYVALKLQKPEVYKARMVWEQAEAEYEYECAMERRMGC